MKSVKRNILLNPGPATTTDSVKKAQIVPDICPREKEFGDVMEFVSNELTGFVAKPETYTTILFCGSGTAAIESVISSVVPEDKTILIINNGAYGERICEIAEAFQVKFIEFKSSPVDPIDISAIEKIIRNNTNISHLSVVHNETTTGLLNNLDEIGAIAKQYNLEFIVDAMSSFGAIPIDMQQQNISYLCASSNKNLQGMAGVSFVSANNESLKKLKDLKSRNYYLNLYAQYESFKNTHQMRFTPPVQTLYALKQAIMELKAETIEMRYDRYSKSWETLIKTLDELNLKYLVENKFHSKIITAIFIPDGVNFTNMHDYFYEKGYTIYPGKVGELNTFRIANIGDINHTDIDGFFKLFRQYLTWLKY